MLTFQRRGIAPIEEDELEGDQEEEDENEKDCRQVWMGMRSHMIVGASSS